MGAGALRGEHGHWGEHGHQEPLAHRAPYLQVELIERVCQGVGVVLLVVLVVVLLCRDIGSRVGSVTHGAVLKGPLAMRMET